MKSGYLILLIVAICNAQESLTFCQNYVEYDITHYGKFISHMKVSNTTDIILADYRLMVIDDELNVLSSVSIPKETNYTCEWIFKQSPGLIFIGCQKSGKSPYLVAYRSINNTHFSQFGDIQYFPQLDNEVLKVSGTLNTFFTVTPTEVRLFTLVVKQTNWGIQTTQNVFDKDYFGALGSVVFVDISFSPFSSDNLQYYKLILVDQKGGAYWVDTIVNNNILQPVRSGRIYVGSRLYYYISAFIHSTTQNESVISFINSDDFQGHPCVQVNYDQNSTSVKFLFHYQTSSKDKATGSLIYSRNQEGIMFRDKLKNSELWIYNTVIKTDQQIGIQQPIDKLSSPPQDYPIFYFNTDQRVVHSIENNKLQICDLYNYKVQKE